MYDDTARSSDILYFGGVEMHDPFIAMGIKGRKIAVVSALEFGRVKRTSDFDSVLPLEACMAAAKGQWPRQKPGPAIVIALVAKQLRVGKFAVPDDFSAGLYTQLGKLGIELEIAEGMFFPEREIKSPAEAAKVREGNRCSEAGLAAAESVLRSSRIRKGRLYYRGGILTSERLKVAVEIACIEAGSVSTSTIVAGGDQACDPHDRGSGPLRPHELIICDIFPRVTETGFFGDMTRTFLKGRASDAQRDLVGAVRQAQLAALHTIKAGVPASVPHAAVESVFASRGYRTRKTAKGSVGFFHGTGHGLGLAIHEPPRMNATAHQPLKLGTVVTVEPGLYYPGLGGCRIEDVVQVTAGAPRMLSKFHYTWELR